MKATTRRVDTDLGVTRWKFHFERGRGGLVGAGELLSIPVDEVDDVLRSFDVDDEVGLPGCGPVAFGALPFDPDAPAVLHLPAELFGRADDGTRWHTIIETDARVVPAEPSSGRPPSRFAVEPTRSPESWCALVEQATKRMTDDGLRKVVLAREVTVTADEPFEIDVVLGRLRSTYPGCHVFAVDGFVGASPELLVSRAGDIVRSHPMAGTAPRGGDPTSDARLAASLLASAKDRQEHQITIDMVHDTLLPWCSYLDYEAEPSIVPVANVQHLATIVEGRLSSPAPSVLELVARAAPDTGGVWLAAGRGAGVHPRPRGIRPRTLRRRRRLGRRPRQRHLGRQRSLRRHRGSGGTRLRRQRDRGGLGSGNRARRDPRQAPSPAERPRPPLTPATNVGWKRVL